VAACTALKACAKGKAPAKGEAKVSAAKEGRALGSRARTWQSLLPCQAGGGRRITGMLLRTGQGKNLLHRERLGWQSMQLLRSPARN
jgi:hypothetical protein